MKKIATTIFCALIILVCFGAIGFLSWQIKNNQANTLKEAGLYIFEMELPSIIIYITATSLYEYWDNSANKVNILIYTLITVAYIVAFIYVIWMSFINLPNNTMKAIFGIITLIIPCILICSTVVNVLGDLKN